MGWDAGKKVLTIVAAAGVTLLTGAINANAADLDEEYYDPPYTQDYQGRRHDNGAERWSPQYRDYSDYQSYRDRRKYYSQDHFGGSYKDGYSPEHQYSYRNDPDYPNCAGITRMPSLNYSRHCQSTAAIYDRLRYEGWHDFKRLRIRPRAFRVFAKNRYGERFRLRIDRCTGEILRAKRKLAPFYRSRLAY